MAEFEYGSPDRGRVLFEDLLNSYPKRSDLWNLYVDKEIKQGFFSQARQLFERMTGSKQNVRTMKGIFKKFLEFEILHGSEASQEAVKEKAREYVNSIA
jgi:rRNA biogenesis protein RRP5